MSFLPTTTRPTPDPLERTLFRQRRLLIGVMAAALAAAAAYLWTSETPMLAVSRICVQPTGPTLLTESGPRVANLNYILAQCEVIRSVPVLSDAIASLNTGRMRLFAEVTDPVGYCRDNLKLRTGQDEFIVTISMESAYPAEAAAVVDAVVNSYIAYQSRQIQSSAGEVVRILHREKDKCIAELQQKSRSLADFRQAHGTLSFEHDGGNIILQKLASLSAALTTAQVERMRASAACQAAEACAGDPAVLRRVVGSEQASAAITSLEKELGVLATSLNDLEARLGALSRSYSARHPSVEAARGMVDQVKARITQKQKSLGEAWIAATRAQSLEAQAHEREVRRAFDEQQKAAMTLNHAAAEYAVLDADVQRSEKLCDAMESRIKAINVNESAGALNISVLERADGRGRPTSFRAGRIFGLAVLVGSVLGVVLALLREMLDKRFRSSRDIVEQLGVPVLGVVPRLSAQDQSKDLSGDVVEACRTLRAALRFGVGGGGVHKLLVTSPAAREGRTSVAVGLAIAAANAGQRVLLLEADFRRPSLRERFGIASEAGLSSILRSEESLDRACHHTSIHGLVVLPAGAAREAGSALLEGKDFASLLEHLARDYDQIIIDAPQITDVPETSVVAAMCDGVVLVIRAGLSASPEAQAAMQTMQNVGVKVMGAVVNAAPRGQLHTNSYGEGWYCCCNGQTGRGISADGMKRLSLSDRQAPPSMAA